MARKRIKNSVAGTLATTVAAGTVGFVLGRRSVVPDFDEKLDRVAALLREGKNEQASKLLLSTFDDLGTLYNRMGGTAQDVRRRMQELNRKLPGKNKIFALESLETPPPSREFPTARRPAMTRTLKNRLLR